MCVGMGEGVSLLRKQWVGEVNLGLKKDNMKSSVRKNHLGSNLVVAGELNETCLWPTSKKALT